MFVCGERNVRLVIRHTVVSFFFVGGIIVFSSLSIGYEFQVIVGYLQGRSQKFVSVV